MSIPSSRHHLRVILRERGFRRLLDVRLSSQLADGWFQAGLAGSVLFNPQRQAGPVAVATSFALLLLPYSLIGPFVGVFLDRWSRRSIIVLANLLRAALVIPAAWLIRGGDDGPIFILLALLIIGVNRFFLAGLSAALPRVVADPQLVTANAAATTLGTVIYSIGLGTAALAGRYLVGTNVHGYSVISAAGAVGYLASALLARVSFRPTDLGPSSDQRPNGSVGAQIASIAGGMVAGIRHLGQRRAAAYAIIAQGTYRILYGVLTLSTLLLFRNYFHPGHPGAALAGLSQVVVAGAAGAMLAAALTPAATRRFGGGTWITWLLFGVATVLLALALPFRAELLVLATFLINIAAQGTKIVVDTAIQHECADAYRGRVFSVNDTVFNISFVAGLFIGVFVLPDNGRSPVVIVAIAAGCALLAAGYGLASRAWARRTAPAATGR